MKLQVKNKGGKWCTITPSATMYMVPEAKYRITYGKSKQIPLIALSDVKEVGANWWKYLLFEELLNFRWKHNILCTTCTKCVYCTLGDDAIHMDCLLINLSALMGAMELPLIHKHLILQEWPGSEYSHAYKNAKAVRTALDRALKLAAPESMEAAKIQKIMGRVI
jgi:hypothetical protein